MQIFVGYHPFPILGQSYQLFIKPAISYPFDQMQTTTSPVALVNVNKLVRKQSPIYFATLHFSQTPLLHLLSLYVAVPSSSHPSCKSPPTRQPPCPTTLCQATTPSVIRRDWKRRRGGEEEAEHIIFLIDLWFWILLVENCKFPFNGDANVTFKKLQSV